MILLIKLTLETFFIKLALPLKTAQLSIASPVKQRKIFATLCQKKIYLSLKRNLNLKGIKYETRSKLWKKKDFTPRDIKIAYENFKLFKKNKKV